MNENNAENADSITQNSATLIHSKSFNMSNKDSLGGECSKTKDCIEFFSNSDLCQITMN